MVWSLNGTNLATYLPGKSRGRQKYWNLWPGKGLADGVPVWRHRFSAIGISIIKIRRFYNRLIFIMEIPLARKTVDMILKLAYVCVSSSQCFRKALCRNVFVCCGHFDRCDHEKGPKLKHYDVMTWKHFPHYWPFVMGQRANYTDLWSFFFFANC